MLRSVVFLLLLPTLTGAAGFRDYLKDIPTDQKFVVGTPTGKAYVSYKMEIAEPAQEEPREFSTKAWRDFHYLKEGSHMMVGEEKVDLHCMEILAYDESKEDKENYHMSVYFQPNKESCSEEHSAFRSSWVGFFYVTEDKGELKRINFSYLGNIFRALVVKE